MHVIRRARACVALSVSLVVAASGLVVLGGVVASPAQAAPATCTVSTPGSGATIPDGGVGVQPATASVNVDAGEAMPVLDVNVELTVTHAAVEELKVVIDNGSGTSVTLADVPSLLGVPLQQKGANFTGTVFDDEATAAFLTAQAPFAGPHKPLASLTAFDGTEGRALWTLTIADEQFLGAEGGQLVAWAVVVTYDCDRDKDGVRNLDDNCPDAANLQQENLDRDALGDACDADDDGDLADDERDNCPGLANPDQADTDGDGAQDGGDACDDDADGDGFAKGDQCPLVYAFTDTGCPEFGRTATAKYVKRKAVFKGRLETPDSTDRCHQRQPLKLMRVKKGRDERVGDVRTNRRGVWKEARNGRRPGRFYVIAMPVTIPEIGYCKKARSPKVRLRR